MKQLRILLALRFRALVASLLSRSKNRGSGIGATILVCVLFGYIAAVFGFSFFSIFSLMRGASGEAGGDTSFYLSFAAALTLAVCLFGSTLTAQSQLYQAKDTAFLLAMPISPAAIFSSRLVFLVLLNLLYGSCVALPAFIVYCMYDFTVWGACLFAFFFLLILFLALALSCLFGWLLALISSRIKRKNLFTTLFSVAFFALYLVLVSSAGTVMEDVLAFSAAASPFLAVFVPVSAGILGKELLSPALFALVALAFVALVACVLIRSYTAILTADRGGVQYVYREKRAKAVPPVFSVIRKELYRFVGSPMYMMNAGIGLLMAVLAGGAMLVAREKLFDTLFATPELAMLAPILPVMVAGAGALLGATVFISAPSISLEAKSLWIWQSMPVSARTVLMGKTLFHILIASPFFLVFSLLAGVALSAGPLDFLAILLLPQAASAFAAFFGTTVGLLIPKFDWTSETAAVKSSAASGITMLGMMAVGLACEVLCAAPFFLGMPAFVGPAVAILLLCGGSFGFYAYLTGARAARRFARLQN